MAYYSGKVYKICQKRHPAVADRVAEWTRAGAGGAVVMGSNPAQSTNFLFIYFFPLKKFLSFLVG